MRRADRSGSDELVVALRDLNKLNAWSPDGRFLIGSGGGPAGVEPGIWAAPVDGTRTPVGVVPTGNDSDVSPDGKWIAYESQLSGRGEIYAQPFLGPGERVRITTTGGAQVRWRGDGKELFYIAPDGRLMAVPVRFASDDKTLDPGVPVPLFATRTLGGVAPQGGLRQQYVVSADGQRFLINTVADEATVPPITLILNWKPNR